MAEAAASPGDGWRAEALDVHGPGARRGERGRETDGDRGLLWAASGSLCFAGNLYTWSVPLSWLGAPETDLAGITRLPIRSADRGRDLSLRFKRGTADEGGLADAVNEARTGDADPRDTRALEELLSLIEHELSMLEEGQAYLSGSYAHAATAAAARLASAWLSYWGGPATRLRAATVGVLVAAAEANAVDADDSAGERYQQAARRWKNVCEDLSEWCGVPAPGRIPAVPGSSSGMGGAGTPGTPIRAAALEPRPSAPIAEPPARPPAAAAAPPSAPAEAPAARPQETAAPRQPAPSPAAGAVPAAGGRSAAPAEEDDEEGTQIIRAEDLPSYRGGQQQPRPAQAAPEREPAEAEETDEAESTVIIQTPPGGVRTQRVDPREYEEATVLAPRGTPVPAPVQRSEPPPPPPAPVERAPAAVVSGPGRKGSGGMTLLFRRSGPGPLGSIARKELQADAAAQPDVRETFLDIGRRFAAVQHQNFIRILDAGDDPNDGLSYIDMEFVEGETVTARLRRGPLPPEQAFDVVDQVAAAIDAVHQARLIHGDVRPQNILVEPGGRAVLLEPSVAVDHELEQRRGTIYGELPYLTLERVRGEPDLPASDVYALATVAYALLAGRPPWDGEPADIFAGHEEEAPPPIERHLPGAPPAVNAVLAAGLGKRPTERPRTATAFARSLRESFTSPPAPAPRPAVIPTAAQARPTVPLGAGDVPPSIRPPAPRPRAEEQAPEPRMPRPQAPPAPAPRPAMPAPAQQAPSPLGRAPSPLGRAPSPLGRNTPPPAPMRDEPPDDDSPDDNDRTIIVRPRQ